MPGRTESELDSSTRISYPVLCMDVKTEVTERMPKVRGSGPGLLTLGPVPLPLCLATSWGDSACALRGLPSV